MLPKRKQVLIFPAGAENALEVYRSINRSVHIRVVPASSRDDISELVYNEPVRFVPEMDDPDFLYAIKKLLIEEQIDVIIPTHDSAMLFFAIHAAQFTAKIVNADLETNRICRSKRLTYAQFAGMSFNPIVYAAPVNADMYPLFAKPDEGQGGKGVRLVRSKQEHLEILADPQMVVTEYLPGNEVTVDCFTNRFGELLFVGPRLRADIRMGISFRANAIELTDEISMIAQALNSQLKLRGMWFFQLKEDSNGRLKLLEVCTRAAGTGGYFRHMGINLPLLTIFDLLDQPVTIVPQPVEVELFRTTRNYYRYAFQCRKVYVDLDDTLIVEGLVNHELMRFLYKAVSKGKNLILITRHEHDPVATLEKHRISPTLFDQIIHLQKDQKKSAYISGDDAILIDNWYQEREEVRQICGIPVFDVDVIESLETIL